MSESISTDWGAFTVIDGDELLEHLLPPSEMLGGKIEVKSCCIALGGDTINTAGFIEFLKEQFPYFVLSKREVEETVTPHLVAQERAGMKEDHITDGMYGELLLFVLVDGLLNIPMICHKLSLQSNPLDEQKASDGVFFGEYQGEESLGMGEAKFYSDRDGEDNRKAAIRDALKSATRFHGAEGTRMRGNELNVAANNLSENLTKERIAELAETLTTSSSDYRLIHPIFIGYESQELHDIQTEPMDRMQLEERITDLVEEDGEIVQYIRQRVKENHKELARHWLIFILLPVEDSNEFKRSMKEAIYPYST